MRFRATSE